MFYFYYNVILIWTFVVRMESMEIDPVPSPMRKVSGIFCIYVFIYMYIYTYMLLISPTLLVLQKIGSSPIQTILMYMLISAMLDA